MKHLAETNKSEKDKRTAGSAHACSILLSSGYFTSFHSTLILYNIELKYTRV